MKLTTCRELGYGAEGPIPWTALRHYAEVYGYDGDEFEEFEYHVGALDVAYLVYRAETVKTKQAPDGKKPARVVTKTYKAQKK